MASADKKAGRKAAGSWTRPGTRKARRAASKKARQNGKRATQNY